MRPYGLRFKVRDGSPRFAFGWLLSTAKPTIVKITGSNSWTKVTTRLRHVCIAFFTNKALMIAKLRDSPVFLIKPLLNATRQEGKKIIINLLFLQTNKQKKRSTKFYRDIKTTLYGEVVYWLR